MKNPSFDEVERLWGSRERREVEVNNIVTYSRENWEKIKNAEEEQMNPAGSSMYR